MKWSGWGTISFPVNHASSPWVQIRKKGNTLEKRKSEKEKKAEKKVDSEEIMRSVAA